MLERGRGIKLAMIPLEKEWTIFLLDIGLLFNLASSLFP